MAVGCRLVLCLQAIPVAILLWHACRRAGGSERDAKVQTARLAGLSLAAAVLMYAPLFAFYGPALLVNFPWQTLRYHVSAFTFRMLIGLGACFWALVAAFAVSHFKRLRAPAPHRARGVLAAALLMSLGCSMTLFRVPHKAELALPVLAGTILVFQVFAGRVWSYALLLTSIIGGLAVLAPYDNQTGVYGWKVGQGWYEKTMEAARENRLQINTVRAALARQPNGTVLLARCAWTEEQARRAGEQVVSEYAGVQGLALLRFAGLSDQSALGCLNDPKLSTLLDRIKAGTTSQPIRIVHDKELTGLLTKGSTSGPAYFGTPLELPVAPAEELWKHLGKSNADVVDAPSGS